MEISILLAEQIIAMFLTMAVGFGVVRAGLFKTDHFKYGCVYLQSMCSRTCISD